MPDKKLGLGPSRVPLDNLQIKNYLDETTDLSPDEERRYRRWWQNNKVKDIDPKTGEPYDDVFYDMRGYWKEGQIPGIKGSALPMQFEGAHGPDTYKQHGHDTFSVESQYSKRFGDGGYWLGDKFMKSPRIKR